MSKKTTMYVSTEETIIRRRKTVVKVEQTYVQLYKNVRAYTLMMAPGSPVDLMLFLITKMNDNNGVQVNQTLIKEYIGTLPKLITERTFFRLLKTLQRNNVLFVVARGEYKLNPAFVWQGDIGTRLEHIRFMEEGGIKLKANETLLLDRRQEHDGSVTVNENPDELRAMVDYGEMNVDEAKEYIEDVRDTIQEHIELKDEALNSETPPVQPNWGEANWVNLEYPEPEQ